jgi:flagellar FliJ protein
MKRFDFRLASVWSWRHLEREMEQARLEGLLAELREIENRLAGLEAERRASARAVLGRGELDAAELSALEAYLRERARRREALAGARADCGRRIEEQRRRVLEAERNARLLDKLKDRRLAEWRAECNRELETLAAETFLAHWGKEK